MAHWPSGRKCDCRTRGLGTSCSVGLRPRTLPPSPAGVSSAMLKTISPSTAAITSRAMRIPRQFLCVGVAAANSWKPERRCFLKYVLDRNVTWSG
ncbi:hypothetical protein SFRURICE_012820 [Spodoptera frugiperda]|uniref:SFRICE_037890 n=1 Tax=Spodoptera frugiperda TaxID=7108 RepID=A0A2H1WVX9_SPOFR|nr:hypothetical protein SFRURICE_012820 [Spodoptera frugiperda]